MTERDAKKLANTAFRLYIRQQKHKTELTQNEELMIKAVEITFEHFNINAKAENEDCETVKIIKCMYSFLPLETLKRNSITAAAYATAEECSFSLSTIWRTIREATRAFSRFYQQLVSQN